MTPAKSRLFMVRSRCKSEVDSGMNSAKAIAPNEVSDADERNKRFKALFHVKAVRKDCTYRSTVNSRAQL